MRYYEVAVSSGRYHGLAPLTYSHNSSVKVGSLVTVKMKTASVNGIIMSETKKPSYKTRAIEKVTDITPLTSESLQLLNWIVSYYPGPLGLITSLFLPSSFTTKQAIDGAQTPTKHSSKLPPLTKDQGEAIKIIDSADRQSFVLHGITGSGKTRVYLELARRQLDSDKSALILTPEIGLTPQLVNFFSNHLKNQIILVHSNLSAAQKNKLWVQIHNNRSPIVVIGPRSALFAPVHDIGLIVVDEFHDSAYKQEQVPYYRTSRVAAALAKIHSAKLVMGSATPDISELYLAAKKNVPIINMEKLAVSAITAPTRVSVVDIKNKQLFSKNPYFSDLLLDAITQTLEERNQTLIFLNRRGSARQILCQSCGWQAVCPNCDLPLTFHADKYDITCHTCGYTTSTPTNCPKCASADILYRIIGTKYVEAELKKLFPDKKIMRFDSDNKKLEKLEQHFAAIEKGGVDILIGTQILAKGLDLPNLGLVGVVNADSSLAFPDYTAEERTYQLISQIIGRIGRGHTPGVAIIQTHNVNNLAINLAINKKWGEFYEYQIKQRQLYGFPPFYHMARLSVRKKSRLTAAKSAENLAKHIASHVKGVKVMGPSPRFYEKSKQGYSWQIIVKSAHRDRLIQTIKTLPSGWTYDLDPSNLL